MSPLIGILSDTHDNQANLQTALGVLREKGVEKLVHCGDLTSPETTLHLYGFHVIHVTGNGDLFTAEIRRRLLEMRPDNFSGVVYEGEIEGIWVAATHGHIPGKIEQLTRSGRYQFVFRGHSHHRKVESIGNCTVINPGALGGVKRESRSFGVFDLAHRKFQLIELP